MIKPQSTLLKKNTSPLHGTTPGFTHAFETLLVSYLSFQQSTTLPECDSHTHLKVSHLSGECGLWA